MADATRREKHDWEAQMASVSLAGIRPLAMSAVNIAGGGTAIYTVSSNQLTKRLVIFHDAAGNKSIFFDIEDAPTTDSMPIIPAMYFVVEVEQGEVLRFLNDAAPSVHVHFMEIR